MTKCSICRRRDSFYFRPYSGEHLCRRCFLDSIEKKVRATIGKHKMFEIDERIAVAVSGGKDSVSLLHILAKIEKDYPKSSLCAVTVDEGIRGYRDEAIAIAAENCTELGLEHVVVSFNELFGHTMDEIVKITANGPLTPCAYCGVLRRRALNIAARETGADKIATAHNLDDEVQTFVLNLVHGSPSRSARAEQITDMKKSGFVQRVKPFCETLEREVVMYAYARGIPFQEMPCPYAGEALRNDVRKMLNRLEERHPGLKYTLSSSADKINKALGEAATQVSLKNCKNCGEPTTEDTCQTCQMLQTLRAP